VKYFLDTNICLGFLKGTSTKVLENIRRLHPDDIKIPSVVKAELLLAAERTSERQKTIEILSRFLLPFEIVDFDDTAAEAYARARTKVKGKGGPLPENGLLIAAIVLSRKGVLVTERISEYKRIAELKIENWTK
jgi:tRNA(fMet)-specific endonuclease VapC